MYLQLMRRQRGVQRPVKQVWLPCTLDQMMYPEGGLNETMLLNMIPEGWLPAKPGEVLVSLAYPTGSTGLRNLQILACSKVSEVF